TPVNGYQIAVSREAEAIGHRNPLVMLPIVTLLAKQLQIVEAQGNLRVVDVLRRQVDPVVGDLAAGPAPLAQSVPISDVRRPGALPSFRLIKPPRPRFHGDHCDFRRSTRSETRAIRVALIRSGSAFAQQ